MNLHLNEVSWDLFYLDMARKASERSKDPSTKVGSVIIDSKKRFVSLGFNGFPRKMKDDGRLYDREAKYKRMIHAEENAILFAKGDLEGYTIYVYPFMPCAHCASLISQCEMARVVSFKNNIIRWAENMETARETFTECGIELVEYSNEELEKIL